MIHKVISSLHIYTDKHQYYQTGLIALWESTQRYEPEIGDFPPFAYSYIRGRIMTELNGQIKHVNCNNYPKEEFWDMVEDEQTIEPLEKEILLSYCHGLTDNQTKWVLYTCLEMFSIQEISEKEGVSVSAVKKWRKGAREKLIELDIL
jgi:RNA polymerase sigma factor (sigma-70 family)